MKPRKGPRLGSGPAHQRLLLSGQAASLFTHEAITTTEAKAKALRPVAERLITFAKRGDVAARRGTRSARAVTPGSSSWGSGRATERRWPASSSWRARKSSRRDPLYDESSNVTWVEVPDVCWNIAWPRAPWNPRVPPVTAASKV